MRMKHTSPKGVRVTQAYWGKDRGNRWKVTNQQVNRSEEGEIRWYTVRRDKSGSEAETGRKQRRDRYGLHTGSSGSARERDWVVGSQILTHLCEAATSRSLFRLKVQISSWGYFKAESVEPWTSVSTEEVPFSITFHKSVTVISVSQGQVLDCWVNNILHSHLSVMATPSHRHSNQSISL